MTENNPTGVMLRKVFIATVLLALLVGILLWHTVAPKSNSDFQIDPDGSNDFCAGNFKSWKDGAITVLQPHIAKNCSKIFRGDAEEVKRVLMKSANWKNSLSDQQFFKMTKKCSWVRYYFDSNMYVTDLERSFPIAFTLVVHNSPQQVVRLLKVIYRTHNQYCLFPDLSSDSVFIGIFKNIAACLHNVHIPSKLKSVKWGHHSIMDAQMSCFNDLLRLREHQPEQRKWKYIINLCGKELPLTTNHEIVSHLIKLNGSSAIVPGLVPKGANEEQSRLRHRRIPFNLPYYKSSTYMGISYEFAHFIFTNITAIKVRRFFEHCIMPEEHFYPTIATIPGVPGGYNPNISTHDHFIISHSIWKFKGNDGRRCRGKPVHYVCISNIDGLAMIMRETRKGNGALFHNKYFMEYDHTVMDCMEEELIARNKKEFMENCFMEQTNDTVSETPSPYTELQKQNLRHM